MVVNLKRSRNSPEVKFIQLDGSSLCVLLFFFFFFTEGQVTKRRFKATEPVDDYATEIGRSPRPGNAAHTALNSVSQERPK